MRQNIDNTANYERMSHYSDHISYGNLLIPAETVPSGLIISLHECKTLNKGMY